MCKKPFSVAILVPLAFALSGVGCGDDDVTNAPPVTFGETTFVVVVNPTINDGNTGVLPQPGTARMGVEVSAESGPTQSTDARGVAVLAPVDAGPRTISVTSGSDSGDIGLSIADGDLEEVAVAFTSGGASLMRSLSYEFSGRVVEITPSTPISEANARLGESDVIVFFRGGTYTGDLTFSGSDVTLFGEGPEGGQVTIAGNVTVDGSRNRLRGVRVTGNLNVPGSNAGISFSRIDGDFELSGSGGALLQNQLCGNVSVTGSQPTLIGNRGLSPEPSGC